ncbi:MAG: hypothetical protein HYZ50_10130 [Deltaproteobacteria bacterium]|nr:hypothetical protein [Deltaproteobacteria bacterium]
MKVNQPSKRILAHLRAEADRPDLWEAVEGFSKLSRPAAIRLTPTMAKRLNTLAEIHGSANAEELAKRWLAERIDYELNLIEKARRQVG